jgi:hypothetical protein
VLHKKRGDQITLLGLNAASSSPVLSVHNISELKDHSPLGVKHTVLDPHSEIGDKQRGDASPALFQPHAEFRPEIDRNQQTNRCKKSMYAHKDALPGNQ